MQRFEHFIDGDFVPAVNRGRLDVFEPATGSVYATVADGDAADVDAAVRAAEKAFAAWSGTPAEERARLLSAIADGIAVRTEDFAIAESRDTGKPRTLAQRMDVPRSIANCRFFAAAAVQFASESHISSVAVNYSLRDPHGVVGCITPWNLPLLLFTWKVAPALAAGNCVVAKPSELTPATELSQKF
ncbi:MAG TPA: aldehyde dehydrogenase family protein [Burkholderiales bacterium]|nr:aldehyde dehydrogenase family protein [Burkholderiales bacterium]